MAAVGALEAGEAGGEVTAAKEELDGGDGGGAERGALIDPGGIGRLQQSTIGIHHSSINSACP